MSRIAVGALVALALQATAFATEALAAPASASCGVSAGTVTVTLSGSTTSDTLAITTSSGDYTVTLNGSAVASCAGISDSADPTIGVSGSAAAMTFSPGSDTGVTFHGAGSLNTLDATTAAAPVAISVSGGSGTVTAGSVNDSFTGVQNFIGSSAGDTTFSVGTGSMSFAGQGSGNELTLAGGPQGMTFMEDGDAAIAPGIAQTAAGSDTFAGINTLVGSSAGQNTLVVGASSPGLAFEADGSGNEIDLSALQATEGSPVVVDTTADASPLPDEVTASGQTWPFSGVQTFKGSSAGYTEFDSNGSNGLTFTGQGSAGNVLDLGAASTGTQAMVSGDSAGAPGSVSASSKIQSFSGIETLEGSTAGDTTFVAGSATGVALGGQGTGNTLDLSAIATASSSPLTVDTVAGTVATSSQLATFSDIRDFTGAGSGYTTFVTGSGGGLNFTGQGMGNGLSFADVSPAGSGVDVSLTPNAQSRQVADLGSGRQDTFTGLDTITGSSGPDVFSGGAGNYAIDDGGTLATLDDSLAASGVQVAFSNGTARVTGGFAGTTTTTGVSTFIGSTAGGNTFIAPADGGYNFDAPSATTGNTLDLSAVPAVASVTVTSSTHNGDVTGATTGVGGSTTDSFQNLQSFTGVPDQLSTAVLDAGSPWGVAEPVGTQATAAATLAGIEGSGSFAPSGNADYSFYATGDCTGPAATTESVSLSGGNVPASSSSAALPAGSYSYQASYGGDTTYRSATGPCEGFTVAAGPSVSISAPAAGVTYAVGQAVAADFSCRDGAGGPGIKSCAGTVADGSAVDTSTPGAHSFTVTATSLDGQTQTESVSFTVAAGPSVSISAPAAGATYAVGQAVTASYSCRDGAGGPGIKSCAGTVADGSAVDTSSAGSHTLTVTATSVDGQTQTESVTFMVAAAPLVSVSSTVAAAPSVSISAPAAGVTYAVGQAVAADFSCRDGAGGPGIKSCAGTVADGSAIDTSTPGAHSFTVTATSLDGQTQTESVTYTVTSCLAGACTSLPTAQQIDAALGKITHPASRRAIRAFIRTRALRLHFGSPSGGTVEIRWRAWTSAGKGKHVKERRVVVATGTASVSGADTITVPMHLTAAGRELLLRHPDSLSISSRAEFKPTGGTWVTYTARFIL